MPMPGRISATIKDVTRPIRTMPQLQQAIASALADNELRGSEVRGILRACQPNMVGAAFEQLRSQRPQDWATVERASREARIAAPIPASPIAAVPPPPTRPSITAVQRPAGVAQSVEPATLTDQDAISVLRDIEQRSVRPQGQPWASRLWPPSACIAMGELDVAGYTIYWQPDDLTAVLAAPSPIRALREFILASSHPSQHEILTRFLDEAGCWRLLHRLAERVLVHEAGAPLGRSIVVNTARSVNDGQTEVATSERRFMFASGPNTCLSNYLQELAEAEYPVVVHVPGAQQSIRVLPHELQRLAHQPDAVSLLAATRQLLGQRLFGVLRLIAPGADTEIAAALLAALQRFRGQGGLAPLRGLDATMVVRFNRDLVGTVTTEF